MTFLSANNYTLLSSKSYEYATKNSDIVGLSTNCHSESILCFGGGRVGAKTIRLIACAKCFEVLSETELNKPELRGASYWYFTPSVSFGFSDTPQVLQNKGDKWSLIAGVQTSFYRMSWLLDGKGGYRLGAITNNYNTLIKYIYIKNRI